MGAMTNTDTPQVLGPGEGIAVPVHAGESLRISMLDRGQVVDTWAVSAEDPTEYMSMEHTRVALSKLAPAAGDDLFSNRRRPILHFTEDTSPGVHDTLMAACDPERYRGLGVTGHHNSCAENFTGALDAHGVRTPVVPAPLNLFMAIPWDPDGTLRFDPTPAGPGDQVTLTAAIDTLVVLSACPMDVNPINGGVVSAIGYELLPA
jgi:uncharacterized protein YcgI (DUF1989 family)